jgi:DNA-binding transcriptional MocR family regulator
MTSAYNLEQHIDLSLGYPSPALFPRSELESAASLLLNDPESSGLSLQYGDELGYLPLRRALSAWLGSFYNIEPSFDRICITGGASQSIACILSTLASPEYTRYVWVSAPCYHLACRIFENAGFRNRLKAIPEDVQGMDLELLRARLACADAQQPHLVSAGK